MTEIVTSLASEYGLLLGLVLVAFLPNEIWRWAGLVAASGLTSDSEVLVWVRYVAAAIVAALVARLLVDPPGALADVPLLVRVGSTAFGVLVLLLVRRNLLVGMVAGMAVFVALSLSEAFG